MQGISRIIWENHILFWPRAFIALRKRKCGRLLKLSAEIGNPETSTCRARACAKFAKEKSERASQEAYMRSQTFIENGNDTDSANIHPAAGTVSALFTSTLLRQYPVGTSCDKDGYLLCMRYVADYLYMGTDSRTAGHYLL